MPEQWVEVLEKRTRTSKTRQFHDIYGNPTNRRMFDGQIGVSLHYLDDEGTWQDVDPNAEEPDGDGFTVKFAKLSYFGRIDGEGRRRFYPDRNDLSYWIEFKKPFANMGAPTRQGRWFYWNFAHALIGVRFDPDSLKFGFRLKDDQAPTTITIPFETEGITRNGRYLLHNGKIVAEMRKPIATGSNPLVEGRPVRKECDIAFGPGELTISLDPTGLDYPIDIDPTVDKQVAASGDDGHVYEDTLYTALDHTEQGIDSSDVEMESFFRWIGVTVEGTVDVAYIQTYGSDVSGSQELLVYGVDEDDPAAPTDYEEYYADPLTSASVPWDGPWTEGDWNQSPSLVGPFQELVDSYGPISNKAMMIQIRNDKAASGVSNRCYSYSYDYDDHSYGAKLYAEYSIVSEIVKIMFSTVAIPETSLRRARSIRPIAETLALPEVLAKRARSLRAMASTVALIDADLRGMQSIRPVNEMLAISEGLLRRGYSIHPMSSTVSITEGLLRRGWSVRFMASTVSISEVLSRIGKMTKTVAESLGITEAVSRVSGMVKLVSETVAITEAWLRRSSALRFMASILELAESKVRRSRSIREIASTLTIADSFIRRARSIRQMISTLTISETLNRAMGAVKIMSDMLGITDTKLHTFSAVRLMSSTIEIADASIRRMWSSRPLQETLSISDSSVRRARAVRIMSSVVSIVGNWINTLFVMLRREVIELRSSISDPGEQRSVIGDFEARSRIQKERGERSDL